MALPVHSPCNLHFLRSGYGVTEQVELGLEHHFGVDDLYSECSDFAVVKDVVHVELLPCFCLFTDCLPPVLAVWSCERFRD